MKVSLTLYTLVTFSHTACTYFNSFGANFVRIFHPILTYPSIGSGKLYKNYFHSIGLLVLLRFLPLLLRLLPLFPIFLLSLPPFPLFPLFLAPFLPLVFKSIKIVLKKYLNDAQTGSTISIYNLCHYLFCTSLATKCSALCRKWMHKHIHRLFTCKKFLFSFFVFHSLANVFYF